MADTTTPATLDGLPSMLAGLDIGSMLAGMGIPMPDADSATTDDVAESLDELHAKVDWLAAALVLLTANVPAKFRPDLDPLGAYPT